LLAGERATEGAAEWRIGKRGGVPARGLENGTIELATKLPCCTREGWAVQELRRNDDYCFGEGGVLMNLILLMW